MLVIGDATSVVTFQPSSSAMEKQIYRQIFQQMKDTIIDIIVLIIECTIIFPYILLMMAPLHMV